MNETFAIEGGCFAYGKDKPLLLDHIRLTAESGELVAILGPNGAGKTTLLRCAMGFLRWNQGRSLLAGRDIREYSAREQWRRMAYVPQARGLASAATVEDLVLLGRGSRIDLFAQPGPEDKRIAGQVLEQLGIERLAQRKCTEISGGELQMALIARALAAQPQVLVLDEPESNLDFKNQLLIMETLSRLAATGMTCLFNTHYPTHALRRANKALLLAKDGSQSFGPTGQVVTADNIQRAFGVKAVIGEIETPERVLRDVVPLSLADSAPAAAPGSQEEKRCLATISLISQNNQVAERINGLLHQYRDHLIGRLGMPYPEAGVFLITVNLDGPRGEIARLTEALALLPGVSVKATYGPENAFTEGRSQEGERL